MPEIMRERDAGEMSQDPRSEGEVRGRELSECGCLELLDPQLRSHKKCAISCSQVITTPAGKTGERLVHQAERRAGVRHLQERKNDTLHMELRRLAAW